jgi:prephenate dehydrogenase (NADP+)
LPQFNGGIENVKINIAMRIYSNKWHVYAGLAIMNPIAKVQIAQYAKSVADLFKLLLQEREEEFRTRIKKAGEFVFGGLQQDHVPILLDDSILDKYSLSKIPKENKLPNSHLSLLAIVDSWHALGINPYEHMVCQTPIFRIWM